MRVGLFPRYCNSLALICHCLSFLLLLRRFNLNNPKLLCARICVLCSIFLYVRLEQPVQLFYLTAELRNAYAIMLKTCSFRNPTV